MASGIDEAPRGPGRRSPSPAVLLIGKGTTFLISPFFVLFLLPLVMYAAVLSVMPLMEPDEARYALIPQYMNQTGDYVTPHLKGVAYLEKPPLAYWATALFFKVMGGNAFAARLAAGLSAWGCILLVYAMGAYFHNRKTGLYSAAVLSVSLLIFALGRINILDMPLTLFICTAIWCGFRYFQSPGMAAKKLLYGFYGASALAFLTKGMIGIVFPPAVIVLWLLWSRRGRDILRIVSPTGMALFAIPVGAWIFAVQRANPDFLWFFFIHEHFLRYTTGIHERVEPFWYYLPVVLAGITPWWAYLAQALAGRVRGREKLFTSVEVRLFTVWSGFIFVFFSLSSSKLASYITPVVLPLAVLIGGLLAGYEDQKGPGAAGEEGRAASWALAPAACQAAALGGLMMVPLFIREYADLGPPGGSWLWLALPATVAAALLIVPEALRKKLKSGWFASIYILFAVYLISLLFPISHYLTPGKSALDVVRAIRIHVPAPAVVYQYRSTMYGIDFYTGRNTPIVEDMGELRFGAERIGATERERRFPTEEQFVRAVKTAASAGTTSFAVTEGKGHVETLRRSFPEASLVWTNGKFYLLAIRP